MGAAVSRIETAVSTRTQPEFPPVIRARLGSGIRLEQADLTPAFLTALKHAASMPNPLVYERQRLRISTWGLPRFLHSFDETIDGGLILPRGLADKVTALTEQPGGHLQVTDERTQGTARHFTFIATPTTQQHKAADALAGHDIGVLVAPPGAGKTVIACAIIAATPPPRSSSSTARPWPISGAPGSPTSSASKPVSSVVAGQRSEASSTSSPCRPWPAATTSPTSPPATG